MLSKEEQFFKEINKAKNVLISFSVDFNGDAISSSLALYWLLQKMGKQVNIVADPSLSNNSDQISSEKIFNFLPGFSDIKNTLDNVRKFIVSLDISNAKVDQIKYTLEKNKLNFIVSPKEGFFTDEDISTQTSGFKYDLIITVDAMDLESLGKTYDNNIEFFYKTPIINIDHHASNEEFGQINIINLNAVSSSEIIFNIFKKQSVDLIDEDIATCLLAGIIYKSKSFKTPNLTPKTLLSTSQLINLGARREEIINNLYRSRSLESLKLWGKVLNNLKSLSNEELIYSTLTTQDFKDTGADSKHLLSVVEELIASIPKAKIIIIFYPQKDNKNITKFFIFSIKNINSLEIVKEYQAQGSQKIAQGSIKQEMSIAKNKILETVKNKLAKMSL
ncbi:MAG TPA: DHH family phosphoesterase [Patescibacteria group bacterium]|nr:DHH family phosphoesterase [Patescibacteria group bacterium]